MHQKADELFRAADHLRFRLLLDEGSELTQATVDLQKVLAPFFVLENSNWTELPHTMPLLDANRRVRLINDVNELLFLWMAAIDESAGDSPQLLTTDGRQRKRRPAGTGPGTLRTGTRLGRSQGALDGAAARLRASQDEASRRVPSDGKSRRDPLRFRRAARSHPGGLAAGLLPVGRARLSSRPALASASNGSNEPPGSTEARTTGINSCSVTSKTRPVIRTTLSETIASRPRFVAIRPGSSSAWLEFTECEASGTGRARTSTPLSNSSKAGPRPPRSGWNWPISTSRWAISRRLAVSMSSSSRPTDQVFMAAPRA